MEASRSTIRFKFHPDCKEYMLDREWLPKETREILKDGSVVLIFESDINLILTGWIRGFGSEVQLLAPQELRHEIVTDLRKKLGRYGEMHSQRPAPSSNSL